MDGNRSIFELLAMLADEYPFIPHTRASRLYSLVRRMKAEKELDIPIGFRYGFVISTETGKAASAMTEQEWEELYKNLCKCLQTEYPNLYYRLFPRIQFIKFNFSKN